LVDAELVEKVEQSRDWHLMGVRPNDPLIGLQWPLRQIDAFRAWRYEKPKEKVSVAVIDTGVDQAHVDLEGRVVEGVDFLGIDQDPYDDNGHGTHVTGIIAANVGNRRGIAGLSRGAQLIPMKSCASAGNCPVFETYEAVVESVRRGAQIINMSLGGAGECSDIDQTVYDYARQQGVLVVVAAGNSGADHNPTISPANCDNTFGVGASDQKGHHASFSSYGDFVDIAAPGVEVWSTVPPLTSLTSSYLGYAAYQGTSMASPFVAAAAAVLKGLHPDWTPEQIQDRLTSTATAGGPRGRDDLFGAGILDLYKAVH
jgi:subtilisin family serine protease